MNFLVAANEKYMHPLKVMLTSLLETNRGERHNIYFLYSDVPANEAKSIKQYVEAKYDCEFVPCLVKRTDFTEFPVSHHFSIETYYRFLAQNIIPVSEDRVLWLDVDMIIRKPLYDFYYQDFEGNTLVVCKSINKNPQALLDKLGCPPGTVYFNAGTILFDLSKLRKIKLKDYSDFYMANKEKITWLDQDILNAMYANETKIADYRIYNMQMFSDSIFSDEERDYIEQNTAIVHYIGGIKPWHDDYRNAYKKYWVMYERKTQSGGQRILSAIKRRLEKMQPWLAAMRKDVLYPLRRLHGMMHEAKTRKE